LLFVIEKASIDRPSAPPNHFPAGLFHIGLIQTYLLSCHLSATENDTNFFSLFIFFFPS